MNGPLLLLFVFCSFFPAFAAKQYSYFRVGNPNDVTTATTAGTALEGGGTDVDAVYQWMCARSGNGDFLVIRATGTDAYNPYIQQLCPNILLSSQLSKTRRRCGLQAATSPITSTFGRA